MVNIGIVGGGPDHLIPDLSIYKDKIDVWIGADRGAWTLTKFALHVHYAVGDFDSTKEKELEAIQNNAAHFEQYPAEKDKTDIEIAILKAIELQAETIYLFGVTGGRLDHELINIQLLHSIADKNIRGILVDKNNKLELTTAREHIVKHDEDYPYISFIPFTQEVKGLSLTGFYYPLENETITWGSTLCISNKLLSISGTFSYSEGILLLIKSRDASVHPIPL